MGMYTELVLKASVLTNIPDQAHAVLRHLFSGGERPDDLPDHPLFRCARWSNIGRGCSFYHTPFPLSWYENTLEKEGKGGHVFSRSDLKNYEQEIAHFLEWVDPYLDESPGACIGWTWYEEQAQPTLIFKK